MRRKRENKRYVRDIGKPCEKCGKLYYIYMNKLCGTCYAKERRSRMPASICHPESPACTLKSMLCENCYAKQKRKKPKTPEQIKENSRKARLRPYKMVQEEFDAMFAKQKGLCAVCEVNPAETIDHSHESTKVRELLCQKCNRGLGHFNDNPSFLLKAYTYIMKHTTDTPVNREHLPYAHTCLGTRWYHSAPLPEDVRIEFIAHSLARLCRFAGHVNAVMYSVAEHSIRVSYLCPPEHQLWALLHDAAESVCVDVPRPLKYAKGMEAYKVYEKLSQDAIMKYFGLTIDEPHEVKSADDRLLVTEQRDLMPWTNDFPATMAGAGKPQKERLATAKALPDKIAPWSTEQAERVFLMRFYELTGQTEFYK